jgi:hypothetical protein
LNEPDAEKPTGPMDLLQLTMKEKGMVWNPERETWEESIDHMMGQSIIPDDEPVPVKKPTVHNDGMYSPQERVARKLMVFNKDFTEKTNTPVSPVNGKQADLPLNEPDAEKPTGPMDLLQLTMKEKGMVWNPERETWEQSIDHMMGRSIIPDDEPVPVKKPTVHNGLLQQLENVEKELAYKEGAHVAALALLRGQVQGMKTLLSVKDKTILADGETIEEQRKTIIALTSGDTPLLSENAKLKEKINLLKEIIREAI